MSPEKPGTGKPPRIFRKAKYGTDKLVLVQRHKIHYVEAGKGEPVIMIPGSYFTYRVWKHLMPLLAGQYRLLALDYQGVGDPFKSHKDFDSTVRQQSDEIVQMARQLNLGQVNLIGGTYGGAIAFDMAARYPELTGKVVSISGYIIKPGVPEKAAGIPWEKIGLARKESGSIEEEAKAIKSPVLYLYGLKSNQKEIPLSKNLEFLQTYLPQAWIVALEGSIFETALKNPQEIASLILDFLRKKPELRVG
jgi:hypothetical protein